MIKVERFVHFKNIFLVVFIAICSQVLSSCISDDYSEGDISRGNVDEQLMLTFVVPNINVATRAEEGYEDGSVYENLVDINGHDYSIYFFTFDESEENYEKGGTLIAQFTPTRITSSSSENETLYTVSGVVPDELLKESNFRVVVLANCGSYPDVVEGTTTIDDLTNNLDYSTFLAEDKFEIDADNLIPFYGVQEYSGVSFNANETIELEEEVSLLRALAKVEIVLYDDEFTFSDVTLHNYNSEGYSAPEGVYLSSQYHTGVWNTDYVQDLHLVGGENDNADSVEGISFKKTKDRVVDEATGDITQYETWVLYVLEYDNTSEGVTHSYIEVKFDNELTVDAPYQIFFQDYDGTSGKPIESSLKDIHRNNLYRFNVSLSENNLLVNVADWDDAFDNEWTFGSMEGPEALGNGEIFYIGSYAYIVIDSENRTIAITYDTKDEGSTTNYQGEIEIPEIVRYDNVNYTVVAIYEETFYLGLGITTVSIPETVTYIGDKAFYDCDDMESITCYAEEPPECGDDVFSEADTDRCILYVPKGCVEIYSQTSPWSSFSDIREIEE